MTVSNIDFDLVDALAASIARHTARRIPLSVDLWSYAEIAGYLKCQTRQVSERYAFGLAYITTLEPSSARRAR